jgi:hypothetical protein
MGKRGQKVRSKEGGRGKKLRGEKEWTRGGQNRRDGGRGRGAPGTANDADEQR